MGSTAILGRMRTTTQEGGGMYKGGTDTRGTPHTYRAVSGQQLAQLQCWKENAHNWLSSKQCEK